MCAFSSKRRGDACQVRRREGRVVQDVCDDISSILMLGDDIQDIWLGKIKAFFVPGSVFEESLRSAGFRVYSVHRNRLRRLP